MAGLSLGAEGSGSSADADALAIGASSAIVAYVVALATALRVGAEVDALVAVDAVALIANARRHAHSLEANLEERSFVYALTTAGTTVARVAAGVDTAATAPASAYLAAATLSFTAGLSLAALLTTTTTVLAVLLHISAQASRGAVDRGKVTASLAGAVDAGLGSRASSIAGAAVLVVRGDVHTSFSSAPALRSRAGDYALAAHTVLTTFAHLTALTAVRVMLLKVHTELSGLAVDCVRSAVALAGTVDALLRGYALTLQTTAVVNIGERVHTGRSSIGPHQSSTARADAHTAEA